MSDTVYAPAALFTADGQRRRGFRAKELTRLRVRHGFSQGALGAKLGVTQAAVWGWEHGTSTPTVTHLLRLARVLDVSVEDLLIGGAQRTRHAKPAK